MIQYIVITFIATVLMGLPLFFAFGFAASMACWVADLPLEAIAQQMMIGMDSFALLAIPGFILIGDIMCQGGIAKRRWISASPSSATSGAAFPWWRSWPE